MSTFENYYRDLLQREKVPYIPLIAKWSDHDAQAIVKDITQAVANSKLKSKPVTITTGATNQSIGNQVEKSFAQTITGSMIRFVIRQCAGAGYPDRELVEKSSGRRFPLEIKATSQWNPSDSNRRVLTCSSSKLRKSFSPPINHLLLTICYKVDADYRITRVRLDFIEPTTEVSVRLEASVNHKLLSCGPHFSADI